MSNAAAVERDPAPLLVGAEWFPDTPGGLNRTFRLLFTGLADAGLRTSAVVVGPVADAPPGVAVIAPGRLPLRMARFARTVTGLSSRANAVDVHFALYGLAAVIAARRRRRPVLVHFHGPWADESAVAGERAGIRLRAKRALERFVYRRGAIHVVHTLAFERLLVERYGVRPWTVAIVPPAVELERFTPGDRLEARARFDIPDGARYYRDRIIRSFRCARVLAPVTGRRPEDVIEGEDFTRLLDECLLLRVETDLGWCVF